MFVKKFLNYIVVVLRQQLNVQHRVRVMLFADLVYVVDWLFEFFFLLGTKRRL